MDGEPKPSKMEVIMKENGSLIKKMEKEYILLLMDNKREEFGKRESGLAGLIKTRRTNVRITYFVQLKQVNQLSTCLTL